MSPEHTQPAPSVLIIDDEPQIRRMLRIILEANAYRVSEAAAGTDGIVEAAQRRPDVVLLDVNMPGMSGIEVVTALSEYPMEDAVAMVSCEERNL